MSRKNFINTFLKIVGGVAVLGVGSLLIAKPKEKSQDYSPFFSQLNDALKLYKRAIPELLIDLDALDYNIVELKKLIPSNASFRIVVKSSCSLASFFALLRILSACFRYPFSIKISM